MSAQPAASAADVKALLHREIDQHRQLVESLLPALSASCERVLELWEGAVRAGGKLLLFGNGGSAADAQHIAAELVIRYHDDRPAIAAIALTTDTSALTAGANDLGFEQVFSRQIEALGRPGDVAVALSTSGRSPNVLAGLRQARTGRLQTTGFTGIDGTPLQGLCDATLMIPSRVTARIQEMHLLLAHVLCLALEQRLALAPRTVP